MSPSREQINLHISIISKIACHFIFCQSLFGIFSLHHRHFFPVLHASANRRFDASFFRFQMASHQSVINLHHLFFYKLIHQKLLGLIVLGHNKQTGRVFIQAVHDAGPQNSADTAQRSFTVMKNRVHQTVVAVRTVSARMDHQPGGFIDDQNIFILINDIQRNIFCFHFKLFHIGKTDFHNIAFFYFCVNFNIFFIHQYRAFIGDFLKIVP